MDKPACSFLNCSGAAVCRGWCSGHYRQWQLGKELTPIDRSPRPTCCVVPECDRPVHGEGLCNMHYLRRQRSGDVKADQPPRVIPPTKDRFWSKVDKTKACWTWTGSLNRSGYGVFSIRNRPRLAHRFAYEELVGPIPQGLTIDHLCQNRACVNPAHMEPVSRGENARRAWLGKTHCKYGHEWTEENTLRTKRGSRLCRECNRRNCAERYARTKATV